jgi:hypothetical protein
MAAIYVLEEGGKALSIQDFRHTEPRGGTAEEWSPVLEHIFECRTCLMVITDLQVPTSYCEEICPDYRALVAETHGEPSAALV